MSERTLRSVVLGLLVLIAVWGVTLVLDRAGGGPGAKSGVANVLDALDPTTVEAVSIVSPGGATVELMRTGDAWSANDYPADTAAIGGIWRALDEATVGNVVASNPSNHARMGLGADSAWAVTFDGGAGVATLLIGRSGPSFSTAYMRLPDENDVVLVDGGVRGALARPLDQWRDRTIVAVDTSRVARIRVEREGGGSTVIERDDEGWTVEGEAARETTLQNLLREASRLTASGFKDAEAPLFEGNERRTMLQDADGLTLVEVRFLGNGTTQHALVAGNETVFTVPNWRADRFTPTPAMALPPDPGG